MTDTPELWAWFVFESGLSPMRAKELLVTWENHGLPLKEALSRLPQAATELGLTPGEAACLQTPNRLAPVSAMTWHHDLYPAGLRHVPLKLRPALLFYQGDASLLTRPLVLLASTPPTPQTASDLLEEALDLILGENWLIGAIEHTPQAALLLDALRHTEGEAALFLRSGLEARPWCDEELALFQTRRLVALSPFPPQTHGDPAWTPLLEGLAIAAANRIIAAGPPDALNRLAQRCPDKPFLGLTRHASKYLERTNACTMTNQPTDALIWLTDGSVLAHGSLHRAEAQPPREPPEPQLSPDEILTILEGGGKIPSILRERLTTRKQEE